MLLCANDELIRIKASLEGRDNVNIQGLLVLVRLMLDHYVFSKIQCFGDVNQLGPFSGRKIGGRTLCQPTEPGGKLS